MITHAKVDVWWKHRSTPDIADRLQEDRDGIAYEDWSLIEELVARLENEMHGLASEVFIARTEELLRVSAEASVIPRLKTIACRSQTPGLARQM